MKAVHLLCLRPLRRLRTCIVLLTVHLRELLLIVGANGGNGGVDFLCELTGQIVRVVRLANQVGLTSKAAWSPQ